MPLFVPAIQQGKHAEFYPATAFIPRITNGPSVSVTETSAQDSMLSTLDFDQTTQEGATILVKPPKKWNLGTITFIPYWTADAGTAAQTCVWELDGAALRDDDPIDTAWGTSQSSSDAFILAGDMHIGPESAAITIGGTIAVGCTVALRIRRVASDTLAADARLIGTEVFWTLTSPTDA